MKKLAQLVMLPTNEKAKVGMINFEPHNKEGNELKINFKDNTITIHKVKDTWTNKERIQFAIDFAQHCLNKIGMNHIQCIGEMLEFENK